MTGLYDNLCGVPWFRRERYDVARASMAAADRLPAGYDLWRERAEQREQDIRRAGGTPHRVNVDDDAFIAFCAGRGQLLDSKARMQFAAAGCRGFQANVTDYENPLFRHGGRRGGRT